MVVQSFTLRDYPVELSLATLICFMGIVEGGAVALVMNRNVVNAWSIGWDSRLLAPVYAVSNFNFYDLKDCDQMPHHLNGKMYEYIDNDYLWYSPSF